MTDITELAQSLENAASKALIEEGLTWFCEEQLSHEDGIALHKADAEFIALANPTNILALVEALEKSEKTSEARREAIGITHKRAARERDRANAAEEALEKAQAQSSKWLEAYHKAVSIGARYEERIAELESRTVKLPEPEQWDITQVLLCKKKVVAAIRAAGIKMEAE
ncbi:TPA: ead/Ea22-like family protein [Klebsiella pneumoniae]|nr:ead/Ea22-like family protein [Klebsiella pneumoniae]